MKCGRAWPLTAEAKIPLILTNAGRVAIRQKRAADM
jgi:hypothetical protein